MAFIVAIFAALFAPTFASWSNTETQTITACATQYGPTRNATESWLDYVSTNTYTTSAWAYFSKTEVLTLRPSTTTISATSTSTSYLYAPNSWTTTVYTETSYTTFEATQTETVPITTTLTVSQVETLTVSAFEGFIPVGSASPDAAKKTNTWELPDDWDVQDVYWTTEPSGTGIYTGYLSRRDQQTGQPSEIDCTETIQSNGFYSTSYITIAGPRATFTRTQVVATETTTFTVHLKPTATVSVSTVEDLYWVTNTSYTTETVTRVQTVSSNSDRSPSQHQEFP